MASKELNCLQKRDLLNRAGVNPGEITQWAARFEDEGLVNDAADFFHKAEDVSGLERLLEGARAEGDAFLFRRINHLLGRKASEGEWLEISKRARELGKNAFAEQAAAMAGVDEGAAPSDA